MIRVHSPSSGANLRLATMRQLEDSPTRASARVTTRIAMLNTISDRVQQSQEQSQAPGHAEALQHKLDTVTSSPISQIPKELTDKGSPPLIEAARPSPFLRYEIETLIELGSGVQEASKVLLKVKPDAIAGK